MLGIVAIHRIVLLGYGLVRPSPPAGSATAGTVRPRCAPARQTEARATVKGEPFAGR